MPKYNRCCYISALVLACFCMKKDRVTFFRSEAIVFQFLAPYCAIFQSDIQSYLTDTLSSYRKIRFIVFGAHKISGSYIPTHKIVNQINKGTLL